MSRPLSLRALLSSRFAITALISVACLYILALTLESSSSSGSGGDKEKTNSRLFSNLKNRVSNVVNGNNNANNAIQWETREHPELVNKKHNPSTRPLSEYPGRKPKTVGRLLENAATYYQKILNQRKDMLERLGFGKPEFNEWNNVMHYWLYYPASFNCPHEIERWGPMDDGGKWMCGMSLYTEKPRAKCVVYSFGVRDDSRFESEILERTDCEVFAYDASVASFGRGLNDQIRPRAHFKPYFIGSADEEKEGVSWRTLKTIMAENGHTWIDILKVDIEGSEYPTFNKVMDDFSVGGTEGANGHDGGILPFGQLQMEFHVHRNWIDFPTFLQWWERLESFGVFPFWTEINLNPALIGDKPWASEYCFINTRGGMENVLIQDF
ncbi:hypothetical protein BG004_001686 [Podila humilis]|nr:hypothetical protein BG004_001686 [Podila humilis]